ncbi:MAG: serpin family protein [Clostridia bacterium]|nr:serpin family protein [Clostridia bacterium]
MKKQYLSILITLCLLLSMLAGCKKPNAESGALADPQQSVSSSADQPTDDPITDVLSETPLAVQDLTAEVAYDTGFVVRPPDEEFIRGQMDFSVELFRRAAQKERCKNTLIAPFSVSMALAMTANGAEGKTLEEMQKVLGGQPIERLNEYNMNWRMALQGGEKTKLHIADSIWIRDLQGFEAKDAFLAANAQYYDAQVFKAPFNKIGQKAINDWVKEKTDGMIPQLIEELRPETVMILINALSFDAQWSDPYSEYHVHDGIFHSIDGKEQKAQMMGSTEYSYLEGEGAIGFTRNYLGGRYAFGALLPTEKSLEEFVGSLDGEALLNILKNKQSTQVRAQLPKFSSEFDISMNEILKAMGMPSAFEGGFGKMSNEDLFISEVLHKATIEVNEDGTRASAATAVEMAKSTAPMAEPKVVTLDRPFLYFIYDRETNLPIFIGTLTSL